MQKSIILFLFLVAVYVSLSAEKTGGLPNPRKVAPAVYLYGTLALLSDFMGGLPVAIAAGLTVALYWRTLNQKKTAKPKKPVKPPAGPIGPVGG